MKDKHQADEEMFWSELKLLLQGSESKQRGYLSYLSGRLEEYGKASKHHYALSRAQLEVYQRAVHEIRNSLAHQGKVSPDYITLGMLMAALGWLRPEAPHSPDRKSTRLNSSH